MIAIVSENGSLLIYNNCSLIWSAQFENIPICISRANVHNLPGAIITLGDEGLLNIGFLGTDPFLFKVPPLNLQDVDFEKTQQELIELENEIQAGLDFEEMSLINKKAEKDLDIDITVGSSLETLAFPTALAKMSGENEPKMCLVSVTVKSLTNLEQLQICFYVEAPLKCSNMIYLFRDIVCGQQERLDTWVFMNDLMQLPNLWMQILFSFVTKQVCLVKCACCTSLRFGFLFREFLASYSEE
jgi:Bardet-Biedl syndrome 9 protein